VEAALQYANEDPEPPTRVLLIGDAPPHGERKGNRIPGQAAPDASNLQPGAGLAGGVLATDYRIEADKLRAKSIKVALRILLGALLHTRTKTLNPSYCTHAHLHERKQ
jgi:hypothetical protein